MNNINKISSCKEQLSTACKSVLKLTSEYQKSLASPLKERKTVINEYYSFALQLSESISLADLSASSVSELISNADTADDFSTKELLGELLDKYVYFRANVQAFLEATEEAKASENFIDTVKRQADVLVRKTAIIEREL